MASVHAVDFMDNRRCKVHLPKKVPRQGTEWGLTMMLNGRLAYEGLKVFHVTQASYGRDIGEHVF